MNRGLHRVAAGESGAQFQMRRAVSTAPSSRYRLFESTSLHPARPSRRPLRAALMERHEDRARADDVQLDGRRGAQQQREPVSYRSCRCRASRDARDASQIRGLRAAVLNVRIHLPPAVSLQTFGSSAGSDHLLLAMNAICLLAEGPPDGSCRRVPQTAAALTDADVVLTGAWRRGFPAAPKLRLLQVPLAGGLALDGLRSLPVEPMLEDRLDRAVRAGANVETTVARRRIEIPKPQQAV
jgi:hypothetical protein